MNRVSTGANRVRRASVVSALSCLILVLLPARATVYWIDNTNGNNSYDGLAPTHTSGTTGPVLNFHNFRSGSGITLNAGDTVFISGTFNSIGVDSADMSFILTSVNGTAASPIIVSNSPGTRALLISDPANVNNGGLHYTSCSWIQLCNINQTNTRLGWSFDGCNNIMLTNCDVEGGPSLTNYGNAQLVQFELGSVSNLFINSRAAYCPSSTTSDGGVCLIFGSSYYSTNDWTSNNIVIGSTLAYAGHGVLQMYGPYNLAYGNFIHNEPWFPSAGSTNMVSHRDIEVGGNQGQHCWTLYNYVKGAGLSPDGNAGHCYEEDSLGTNCVRNNIFMNAWGSGITLYNAKTLSPVMTGGYGYTCYGQNTIVSNGYGTPVIGQKDNSGWMNFMTGVYSTNNNFVNNLILDNATNTYLSVNGTADFSTAFATYSGNLTNHCNYSVVVNPTDSGPTSTNAPNLMLTNGSPAIDVGTFLTAVLSSSGSGTNMQVITPTWFFGGMTAAGYHVPGDTIQLQGQTNTATIIAISGQTLTLDKPLTWTLGQGVALAYSGTSPDAGAFEFTGTNTPAPPIINGAPYFPFTY